MNILLAPNVYHPMATGVPVFTRRLASGLVREGHRVVIVTRKLAQDQASFEVIDGVEVHRMAFIFPWSLLWQESKEGILRFCRHCPIDIWRLVRLMAENEIELINIHSLSGSVFPYVLFARLFADRELVATLHGNEFFRLDTSHDGMRRLLLRHGLRRASRIVVLSSRHADEVRRFCPEAAPRVVTIANGVAVDEFGGSARFPFASPYVLSVSRLNPLKGHDVLLAAFRRVADREENVHLIIVGDGPERIRLHAVCLALGLKDRVTFLGEVAPERVRELLVGCEFLAISSWSEGVPTVALEAMASGRAVVGTRVGGLPELVADAETGLLVPPGNPDSLAEAMLVLLRDRARRKAMGERARAFVKANHDFARTVDQYVDVYWQALREARRGRKKQSDSRSKLEVE
jgi:glycosyltransferase involved in cell wall biosynthesis